MTQRISNVEAEILDKLSINLVSELWEVICDQIKYESYTAKSDFAKIFGNLIYGSECIDQEQIDIFDKYLKDVAVALGVTPDKIDTSTVYENTINLRRLFMGSENLISHHLEVLSSLKINVSTPSQQSIFEHLDPKFRKIIQNFQNLDVVNPKEAGLNVIKQAFGG